MKKLILATLITLFIGGQASAAPTGRDWSVNDFDPPNYYDDDYDDEDYDDEEEYDEDDY